MYELVACEGLVVFFFFFKQKTAYEMCGRDWSSDVCSSDLFIFSFFTDMANDPEVINLASCIVARAKDAITCVDRKSVV